MKPFTYQSNPGRVVFAPGAFNALEEEARLLGVSKVLVLCTPQQRDLAEQAASLLGDRSAGVYDGAIMHVPAERAREAVEVVESCEADACLAVGGGSTIGLGKIIARDTGLPLMVVATTYSGSEMTPIWGMTEDGIKRTGKDPKVLPRVVIYDAELTTGLPTGISAVSGMNAIAHAVEALYAENANPVVSLLAEEGIRALGNSLPTIVETPANIDARGNALYGSWLCGTCLGSVGMALHHKLCHTLGGSFDLPHAEVHTVILPHATAYNASAAPEAMQAIQSALGVEDAARGLFKLAESLGAPTSLASIGMNESDLDRAADIAIQNPYFNPSPVTRDGIRTLLQDAFDGSEPSAL